MDPRPRRPISIDGIYHQGPKRPIKTVYKNEPSRQHLRQTEARVADRVTRPQEESYSMLNKALPSPVKAQEFSVPPNYKQNNAKKKWSRKRKVLTSLLVLLILAGGTLSYVGSSLVGNLDKVFHGNLLSDAQALFSSTTLKGESQGRVNILLAGDSSDQLNHGGANLTDSILILSIDTKNHTAFLLSVPRDLWVDIPGYGWQKINAANDALGTNFPGYPQNGMGQLEHIITTDLGIPIDYYALSDYGAFQAAVNAVGGVSVDIQSPDPRGLYDPNTSLNLKNGLNFLNGQQALNLARARGDGYGSYGFPNSDFDRTQHQRQIFTAIAAKAQTLGFLSNPLKITQLFSAFGNNVQTDLSLQDVLRLVSISKGIGLNTIQSYSYCSTLSGTTCTKPILSTYDDPATGQDTLIPTAGIGDYGQLQQYYEQLTSNNPIIKEAASIVILNGSNVVGLAKREETSLEAKGAYVASVADALNEYPGTMVIDNAGTNDPNTLKLLQKTFPGTTVTTDSGSTEAKEGQGYNANFIVVLGQNWDPSNSQN